MEEVKSSMQNARKISTTMDLWSSNNEKSFATVTAHYVDMKAQKVRRHTLTCSEFPERHNHTTIAKAYKKTTEDFSEKIILGVSDAGSDVKKAHLDDLKLPWWHCYAHKSKNAVDEAVKKTKRFKKFRSKVSKVVKKIRKSNPSKLKFVKCQKKAGGN